MLCNAINGLRCCMDQPEHPASTPSPCATNTAPHVQHGEKAGFDSGCLLALVWLQASEQIVSYPTHTPTCFSGALSWRNGTVREKK